MTLFANVNNDPGHPNSGLGDPLQVAFQKINNNFSYINQIWPDINTAEIEANIRLATGISRFNLVLADTVQSTNFGNASSSYVGDTFTATTSIDGPLGATTPTTATVTDLTVTGTATINSWDIGSLTIGSLNATPIGDVSPSTGAFTTLSAAGNLSIGGNLLGLSFTVRNMQNNLSGNLPASQQIFLHPFYTTKQYTAVSANSDVTISYNTSLFTPGCEKIFVIQNQKDGVARTITLPNDFNNKNSTSIALPANTAIMLHFIPFDSTTANVYVKITNN